MHVFNVGHFVLKIIARHGKKLDKYRRGFKESYINQPIFKLQRLSPIIRPTIPPNPTHFEYLFEIWRPFWFWPFSIFFSHPTWRRTLSLDSVPSNYVNKIVRRLFRKNASRSFIWCKPDPSIWSIPLLSYISKTTHVAASLASTAYWN